jgi:UDP:flavonoid glycosyltransferase YjiC (YdhE family)
MKSKRITLLAFGSTGDVLPYIALALELKSAGFLPCIVTHGRFESLMRGYDLAFSVIKEDPRETLLTATGRTLIDSDNNPVAFGLGIKRILNEQLDVFLEISLSNCRGADLIIASGLAVYVAAHIAEKLNIPYLPAYLQPVTTTSAFPNAFVSLVPDQPIFNRLSHLLFNYGSWVLFRKEINRARRTVLELPPVALTPLGLKDQRCQNILYGYSPRVLPPPSDWANNTHVTGYWFMPSSLPSNIPYALHNFVESGSPPVCIGFGSMIDQNADELITIIFKALALTKQRAVFLTGWNQFRPQSLPESIFAIESAPHEWLFPRVSCVVHHGGAGTTAAALRAGVPSVVVPFFGDQHFWGNLLVGLDAAPPSLSRKNLNAAKLAQAIEATISNISLRRGATKLGEYIRTENGVARATEVIKELLGEHS